MINQELLFAVIVAGGSGKRMNAPIPKQFIKIGDYPILMYTIHQFASYPESIKIFLALPEEEISTWEELCQTYHFPHKVTLVQGGNTRFQSVKNCLDQINNNKGLVAIHDGVRPFIDHAIIKESYLTASLKGNAVVSVPLKDSIRIIEGSQNKSMERDKYRLIQTPQTFKLPIIKDAFKAKEEIFFTDDASVAEFAGVSINLIEGSFKNIKITTSDDLIFGEALVKNLQIRIQ